jgi:hypothetical protein
MFVSGIVYHLRILVDDRRDDLVMFLTKRTLVRVLEQIVEVQRSPRFRKSLTRTFQSSGLDSR